MNRAAMLAPLAEQEIQHFTKDWQGKDGRQHSMTFTYIEDETVMDRLDLGYGPGNWQIQVDAHDLKVGIVKVRLGVRDHGEWAWYEDFGYATREGGEVLKEAVSDGIRRCGRFVGIARDLYRKTTYEPGGALGPRKPPPPPDAIPEPTDGSLIGTAEVGKVGSGADFELRQTPEGPVCAFRLTQGRKGWKVIAHGEMAVSLAALRPEGQRVSVYGSMQDETFAKGGKDITFQVVNLERIKGDDFELPAPPEAPSEALFDEADLADVTA